MSKSRKKGKKAMIVAVYILLFTWIVLLALLIGIYMLRLQGYDNFMEWRNRNQSQEVLQPDVVTPQPTKGVTEMPVPTATEAPAPTEPAPTATSVPEPTPTTLPLVTEAPTEPPIAATDFSGNEAVDSQIRIQAAAFFEEADELCYVSYRVGSFFSIVFQRGETILPLVYNLTTAEQVTGSDLIKESYFAVIKERLQTYVAENFPEEAEDEFVSYQQPYRAEDYQKIYLTENQLVFCFDTNTLTDNHTAFSYAVDLEEAKAFFYLNLDGTTKGHTIRELDPEKPMIAITYDDGPAFRDDLDRKIMELCAQYDAKVTFFFVGNRITGSFEAVAKELHDNGHEIASHTYSHTNMALAKPDVVWTEVNKTNLVIAEATGQVADYIRLPGGSNANYLANLPQPIIHWDIDTLDWKDRDAQIVFERVKEEAEDGAIILIHSIYKTSYEASELFIPWLVEQGYQIVTLSELFYYKGVTLENGVEYDGFSGNE